MHVLRDQSQPACPPVPVVQVNDSADDSFSIHWPGISEEENDDAKENKRDFIFVVKFKKCNKKLASGLSQ